MGTKHGYKLFPLNSVSHFEPSFEKGTCTCRLCIKLVVLVFIVSIVLVVNDPDIGEFS